MRDDTSTSIAGSLREASDLLASLPDHLAKAASVSNYGRGATDIHWYLTLDFNVEDRSQKEMAADLVRLIGGRWDKDFRGEEGSFTRTLGSLSLLVQVARAEVCTRKVVATREVVRTIPASPATPAVSEYTVTETVEDVEWECQPLLGATA